MKRKSVQDLNTTFPETIEFDNEKNCIKIASWNVASIQACIKKGFHKYVLAEQADILCLQETKLQKSDQFISYTDYPFQYQSQSKTKKGYSGTAIFSKIKPIKVEYTIGDEEIDDEGRYIILEYQDYFVINGYVPNAGSKLERLELKSRHYKKLISYLKSLEKPIIFCGDMNVAHQEMDLARPKNNTKTAGFTPQEREDFGNLLEQVGLVDTYRDKHPDDTQEYTYYSYRFQCRSKNIGWRLDYFLVTKSLNDLVIKSEIRNTIYGASDHVPLILLLSTSNESPKEQLSTSNGSPKDQPKLEP